MAKDRASTTYKQCHMAQGTKHHTAWIPTQFAIVDKIVDIDDHGKGWVIKTVGSQEISAKQADAGSQAHKKTRRASDI
jgi:hypothetical protein